jgi:Uma2 family endonuclease
MQLADLDLNKVYTYADYYKWQFDERVELIKGKIFKMSPAPSATHQRLSSRLHTAIGSYLWGKKCELFSAPFDVRLPRKTSKDEDIITVLQPDLCVICDPSKIEERGCLGAPDLVVEVLSPGNSRKELKNKFDVYEEAGVKEYWIVDPIRQTLQINKLENGQYKPMRALTAGDIVTTEILPDFSLNVEELFENI